MDRVVLGRTGLKVSPIAYGAIINRSETPEQTAVYVKEAIEAGINYFDVAPSYGDAMELLGPALAPYRQNAVLACKTTDRTAEGSKRELLASLEALQTDYFDLYQVHSLGKMEDVDVLFGPGGAMETFFWAKQEGIIRNIGMSIHNEDAALKALEYYDFDTLMFPMNWAVGIQTGWGERIAQKAKEKNRGLIAIKSLAHRKWLENEQHTYPKAWCRPFNTEGEDVPLAVAAMKYAIHMGADALIPTGDIDHFRFMLQHIDEVRQNALNEEEWDLLRREAEAVGDQLIFRP